MKKILITIFIYSLLLFSFLFSCTREFTPTAWTQSQEEKITNIVNNILATELEDTLIELNGIRNVAVNEEEVPLYEAAIADRFVSYGYQVETQEVTLDWAISFNGEETFYEYGPFHMNNIIAKKPGINPQNPPVLFTAHWDSVPKGPGIDDNASGCAGVLEGARVLQDNSFLHTILFIIFAFEEDGIAGSSYYSENMENRPKAVINLDMIGFTSPVQESYLFTDFYLDFPRTGDFIGVFATDFSTSLGIDYIRAADTFATDLKYYLLVTDPNFSNDPSLTHLLRSDHAPFWEMGIPAILLTDTAFLRADHPYHTDGDTIDKIDFDFMYNCVKAGIATVCIQADIQ